jgi:hypothetical protein
MTPSGGAYVITVVGELSPSLRAAFDDVEISVGHSVTRLRLASCDPSVLHGVLQRVDALGLDLLDVQREDDTQGGLPP